jgi:hypothetical protein
MFPIRTVNFLPSSDLCCAEAETNSVATATKLRITASLDMVFSFLSSTKPFSAAREFREPNANRGIKYSNQPHFL